MATSKYIACIFGVVAAMPNGLGRRPPLGWNTWKTCGDDGCVHDYCDETEVKTVAEAMMQNGMLDMGYNYINLDDCWAASSRTENDTLTWDIDRFPSGVPALIEWLHERDFKFGLYTSAGNQTCSSGGRPLPVPGSRDHAELDVSTFASWGVDYIKFDWCGDIKKQVLSLKKAHKEFGTAVLQSSRPMFLEVVAGYFGLLGDVKNYANSWRFCEDHKDNWDSTTEQLTCIFDQHLGEEGAPGGWPHMDMLATGGRGCPGPISHCPGQTDDEYKTEFVLWSLRQSPLIVDTDVRNMTSIMKTALLNKELVEIHQSTTTAPGKFLGRWACAEFRKCEIWGRKLSSDGSDWMIALVNRGSDAHSMTIKWSELGWDSSDAAIIRDLWEHEDLQSAATKKYEVNKIPRHSTAILRITKAQSVSV